MNSLIRLVIAVMILLMLHTSYAVLQPIVGFTNTQITATINIRGLTNSLHYGGDPNSMDEQFLAEFSDAHPLVPSGPSYSGPNFYGGRRRVNFDTTNSMSATLNNANSGAGLNFRIGSPTNTEYRIASLFYVKKADFLEPAALQEVNLTDESVISVRVGCEQNASGKMRCVVKIGSQFYISSANSNFVANGSGASTTYTFTGLGSSTWAPYDPGTNLFIDADSATFDTLTLTNINGVGMVFLVSSTGANTFHWKVYQLDVSAFVVPEPGFALALLAGMGLWLRRGQV